MRLAVLQFMAAFCGGLGSLFLLISLGTDYWLLVSESCDPGDKNTANSRRFTPKDALPITPAGSGNTAVFYHEGIFWRCSYRKKMDRDESMLDFWITNQPAQKICIPAYLSHVPLFGPSSKNLISNSTTVQRAFWCIMSILGLTMITIGVFVTICGIRTASRRLYEAGGAFFIISGLLHLVVVVTFALWVQDPSSLEGYVTERKSSLCPGLHLSLYYGPSFMLAPPAFFFCLLCGIFLLLAQTPLGTETANTSNDASSKQDEMEVRMP